jgi:hypothetical protein
MRPGVQPGEGSPQPAASFDAAHVAVIQSGDGAGHSHTVDPFSGPLSSVEREQLSPREESKYEEATARARNAASSEGPPTSAASTGARPPVPSGNGGRLHKLLCMYRT